MTLFYKFWKKTRVYYTLSISRGGGGGPGPRAPPPGFATDLRHDMIITKRFHVYFVFIYDCVSAKCASFSEERSG